MTISVHPIDPESRAEIQARLAAIESETVPEPLARQRERAGVRVILQSLSSPEAVQKRLSEYGVRLLYAWESGSWGFALPHQQRARWPSGITAGS